MLVIHPQGRGAVTAISRQSLHGSLGNPNPLALVSVTAVSWWVRARHAALAARGREHSLFVSLQPGSAVRQEAGVLGDQEVQQTVVVGLRVQLEQGRVHLFLVAIGHRRAADLAQVAHEEPLALGHLLLVPLGQLVQVCILVERGVRPCE